MASITKDRAGFISAPCLFLLLRKLQIVTLWITATHVASSASSSAQQLANFILLHCDKSTSARSSPGFLYLIAKGSSLYVGKRALALLFCSEIHFVRVFACTFVPVKRIKLLHLFIRKREIEYIRIGAHPLRADRFRDDDDVMLEMPADDDLRRRLAVCFRDADHDRFFHQLSARQR